MIAVLLSGVVVYFALVALTTWVMHRYYHHTGTYRVRQASVASSVSELNCDPRFDPRESSSVILQLARELQSADPVFATSHNPSISSAEYLEACMAGDEAMPKGNPFRTAETLPQLELPPVAIKLNPLGPMTRSRALAKKNYF
jgi:hypothetical protein